MEKYKGNFWKTCVRQGSYRVRFFSVFLLLAFAAPYEVFSSTRIDVSDAPDDDLALTISAIQSAKRTLLLNIYELTSPEIADALTERIQSGVQVQILEEGQPVGGLSAAGRGIQSQLVKAMTNASRQDRFFEMSSKATGTHRRFRFDHAKYAVIDNSALLIGSENYSPTGNPQPQSMGNRGWEVLIHDQNLALQFKDIFVSDSNASSGDLIDLVGNIENRSSSYSASDHSLFSESLFSESLLSQFSNSSTGIELNSSDSSFKTSVKASVAFNASSVSKVTSPDTSLSGLTALLDGATTSIDLEMMTFYSYWKSPTTQSPLLSSMLAAARRGVRVRVLLNDETVFAHSGHVSKPKNQPTIDKLNQVASQEGLDMQARVANIKGMGVTYIHNKGALVDADKTLISSINWDENAVMHNREAAVVIVSPEIHDHYLSLFEKDWRTSQGENTRRPASIRTEAVLASDGELESAVIANEYTTCPKSLHIRAQIGELEITDRSDKTFQEFSGSELEADFVRTSETPRVCILTESENHILGTGRRRFVQIRDRTDGTRSLALEGYTSKGKVYSIRTVLESRHSYLTGEWTAGFYDGSGPAKSKLGEVLINIAE